MLYSVCHSKDSRADDSAVTKIYSRPENKESGWKGKQDFSTKPQQVSALVCCPEKQVTLPLLPARGGWKYTGILLLFAF